MCVVRTGLILRCLPCVILFVHFEICVGQLRVMRQSIASWCIVVMGYTGASHAKELPLLIEGWNGVLSFNGVPHLNAKLIVINNKKLSKKIRSTSY